MLEESKKRIRKIEHNNQNVYDTLEALETEIKQKLLIVPKMDGEIKCKQFVMDLESRAINPTQ
mgnify:CR=1 FL=1